ncbi:feruloyl-CoA synthase [Mesorhizobium australicum]|uniref:Feruloyl-CoA synthase n=1 Tax=Mesorhizobium australicum TaxID=536018 RepID=A0A1X7MTY0_9HYPH|nr:feruloyl-CoA synthase [Mesorhizobium australicum]SMH27788.1 feruloyl-CoA synthase [Mesorhizobium australicum]
MGFSAASHQSADETQLSELVLKGPSAVTRFHTLGEMLARSAERAPDTAFLKQRIDGGWRTLSYEQALAGAKRIASFLTECGLSADRPLAILSGNSIDHALLSLGAMVAGIPVAPISVAYSQFSDLTRLREILAILTPGLVFAENGATFANALALADELNVPVIVSANPRSDSSDRIWTKLLEAAPEQVDEASVTSDTIAKVLFTSGSTGTPKGVIVTHGMMCSNQDAMAQLWRFLDDEPPVIVDWLPWNHIFGGTLVFNCALRNAGTLVIDEGRPVPGQFDATIRNLVEARPSVHFGVPRGYGELIDALERDEDFAKAYFSRLRTIFTAGAALPADLWTRLHDLAARYGRPDLRIHVSWGATETAPVVTLSPPDNTQAGNLGVPVPGAEVKLVPNEDKLELRVRGPMVTPGYWRSPELTAQAFDAAGFYRIGDAGKLFEDGDPAKGILFDGRTAENFKLVTGTWVQVGGLRLAVLEACAPLVQEAAIAGHDRDEIGLLIFPNFAACRETAGLPNASSEELVANSEIRKAITRTLGKVGDGKGSSTRIGRALLVSTPPSLEAGEMTDKGYLNQRAVLRERADLVERLYAEPTHPDVIIPDRHSSI